MKIMSLITHPDVFPNTRLSFVFATQKKFLYWQLHNWNF